MDKIDYQLDDDNESDQSRSPEGDERSRSPINDLEVIKITHINVYSWNHA